MRTRSPCQSHGESHPSFVEAWMEKSLGGLCGNTLCAPQIQKLPSGACDGRIRNVESGGVWGGSGWRSCFLLGCLPQNAGDLHPRNTNMKPRNEGFKTMMFLFKGVIFRFYLSFLGSTNLKKKIHHCLAATTTARNSRDATIGSGVFVAFSNRRRPSLQPLRWQTFRSTTWVCFQGFASQGWGVPVQRIPLAKRRQKSELIGELLRK